MTLFIGLLCTNYKPYKEFQTLFDFKILPNNYSIINIYGHKIFDPKQSHIQLEFNNLYVKTHAFLHYCLLWRNRNVSLAYKLKANCYFGSQEECNRNSSFLNHYKLRRNITERTAVKIFGNSMGLSILSKIIHLMFFLKNITVNKSLLNIMCLIIPYGGRTSIEQDFLIWFCRKNGIKTIAIQENWDNLSSKTVLFEHPDFFGTWGIQSSLHLKKIHNFKNLIVEVGSLRIKEFYDSRNTVITVDSFSNPGLNISKKQIKNLLLIGTGDAEFDLAIAKTSSEIIEFYSKEFQSEFRLVYRPHPYSRISKTEFLQILQLKNIEIDQPQLGEKNDYRINLIKHSELIIALYSTVLLEAAILNKPCVIPAFFDSSFSFKTEDYLNEADHYTGFALVNGLFIVETKEKFLEILRSIDRADMQIQNNTKILNWFCANRNTSNLISELVQLALM